MDINLSNIFEERNVESRSVSPENVNGAKGKGGMATAKNTLHEGSANCARELGQGWKVSPCTNLEAGEVRTIMDVEGPGVIRHIWLTLDKKHYRNVIIRFYWDGEKNPSVESPIGDLFCCSWNERQDILAIPINVNPSGGMNMYFPMPFRESVKITVENDAVEEVQGFYYTMNYTLEDVPKNALYFHAQWRRTNPVPYMEDYLMIDGIKGKGHYVGTFMSWQQNNNGWWGEGEIKMFIDGDKKYPTICGTGTEDYFGGAWGFRRTYSAPYLGYQIVSGEQDQPGCRMTLYRFHALDPVYFKKDLKVTMQALGWRSGGRYLPLQDDIASVVYWYQTLPHKPFPKLPERNDREII